MFSVSLLARKLLMVLIVLFPFQNLPKTLFAEPGISNPVLNYVSYLDEISTIVFIILLLSFIAVKHKHYSFNLRSLPFSKYILMFICVMLASYVINIGNISFMQGILGIHEHIKNLIIIFAISGLLWSEKELESLVSIVIKLSIFLAIIGVFGEALAFMGINFETIPLVREEKRLGLYRITSLVGYTGSNYLGMYCILGLSFLFIDKKSIEKNKIYIFLVFLAIILTLSRQAYGALIVVLFTLDYKKRILVLFLSTLLFIAILVTLFIQMPVLNFNNYYRLFAYKESVAVLLDHPLFGTGPGTFGSTTSVIYASPYFNNWPVFFQYSVKKMGSLDSQWPTILAETGLLGFTAYLLFWVILYKHLKKCQRWFHNNGSPFLSNTGKTLSSYTLGLMVMCFATGLNKPFVIYTFMGACGIYFSIYNQHLSRAKPYQGVPPDMAAGKRHRRLPLTAKPPAALPAPGAQR